MSPHRAVFTELVQSRRFTRGAELGVDKGILFQQLLSSCPHLFLIGVDTCPVPHRKARCESIAAEFSHRCQLFVSTTKDASALVRNNSLDFVFIDADHSEDAVTEDIVHWGPKVKAGGWLGGHDYNRKFPGVIRAVDRVFGEHVKTWPGSIWGVWQ